MPHTFYNTNNLKTYIQTTTETTNTTRTMLFKLVSVVVNS